MYAVVSDEQVFHFFFQAEDGIRDLTVTGVQTCALPILHWGLYRKYDPALFGLVHEDLTRLVDEGHVDPLVSRSEERRVGKECRYRWWYAQSIQKTTGKLTHVLLSSMSNAADDYMLRTLT